MIFGVPGHGIHGNDTGPDPHPKYKVDLFIWRLIVGTSNVTVLRRSWVSTSQTRRDISQPYLLARLLLHGLNFRRSFLTK